MAGCARDAEQYRHDPACGTGGMLLATVEHVRTHGGDPRTFFGKLYGQEKNLTTSSVARMNLLLHGIEDFAVERGDILSLFRKGRAQNFLDPEHAATILDWMQAFANVPDRARGVSVEEIKAALARVSEAEDKLRELMTAGGW